MSKLIKYPFFKCCSCHDSKIIQQLLKYDNDIPYFSGVKVLK